MSDDSLRSAPEDITGVEKIDGGWRIKETPAHFIEVYSMLFNDRVVEVPKSNPMVVDRYWCYDKGGAAIHAALLWDPTTEAEPVGWKKAHGNRYPASKS